MRGPSSSISAGQSIRTRIILLVGSILFLFSLLTGYCIYTLISLQPAGVHAKYSNGNIALIEEKLADLLAESRHNADQFIQQQNPESVVQFKSAAARFMELARRLEELAGSNNDRTTAREAGRIISLARQYDSGFQELVHSWEAKGLNESEGLREQLRSAAQQIADLSSGEESRRFDQALSLILTAQNEYLASNAPRARQSLETAVRDLGGVVGESGLAEQQKQLLQKNIKEYMTALNRHQAVSLATSDSSLSAAFANEQQRQVKAMHDAAQRLEKTINELYASQLASQAEVIRRHEEQYLLQGEQKDADLVLAALDQFTQGLDTTSIPGERKTAMHQAVRLYGEAFNAIVRQDGIIKDHAAKVNQSFSELEHHFSGAVNKPALGATVQSQLLAFLSRFNIHIIAGALIGTVLIGLTAAFRLAASISSPILRMSSAVRRMHSADDAAADFPTGRKDELGILARELDNLFQTRQVSADPAVHDAQTAAASQPAAGEGKRTENDENIARIIADQSPLLERINALAGRIHSLCDSSARDIGNITDRLTEFRKSVEAGGGSGAIIHDTDQSSAEFPERIARTIKVTADMAEETGILALNAAIKAARAGSQGRELTILAEELDKLATRAKEAAHETSSTLQTLAPLPEKGAGPGQDFLRDLNAFDEEILLDTRSLQEVGQRIQTIAGHVDALKKSVDELNDTSKTIGSLAGRPQQENNEAGGISSAGADDAAPHPAPGEHPEDDAEHDK